MVGVNGSAQDKPATLGETYGRQTIDTGDPDVVLPVGARTSAFVVYVISTPADGDQVYLGWDEDVTTSNGFPLEEGASIEFDLDHSDQPLYGVADADGSELAFLGIR